jgi:hypothetical protein
MPSNDSRPDAHIQHEVLVTVMLGVAIAIYLALSF